MSSRLFLALGTVAVTYAECPTGYSGVSGTCMSTNIRWSGAFAPDGSNDATACQAMRDKCAEEPNGHVATRPELAAYMQAQCDLGNVDCNQRNDANFFNGVDGLNVRFGISYDVKDDGTYGWGGHLFWGYERWSTSSNNEGLGGSGTDKLFASYLDMGFGGESEACANTGYPRFFVCAISTPALTTEGAVCEDKSNTCAVRSSNMGEDWLCNTYSRREAWCEATCNFCTAVPSPPTPAPTTAAPTATTEFFLLETSETRNPCYYNPVDKAMCKDYARENKKEFYDFRVITADPSSAWFGEKCYYNIPNHIETDPCTDTSAYNIRAPGCSTPGRTARIEEIRNYHPTGTIHVHTFEDACVTANWYRGTSQSGIPQGCAIKDDVVTWNPDRTYMGSGRQSTACGDPWGYGRSYHCICTVTDAPTPAPTTPAPTATILLGDAHLFGPHGDRTDFKGRNNTYYNVLSTNNLSVAVLFMHDTYNWRNKVVFGSWMKAIAVSALTAENKVVMAAYHCERPAMMDVHSEGDEDKNGQFTLGSDFIFQEVEVSLSKAYAFAVSNGEWEVEAKNSYLPYASQNEHKKRLDVNLKTIANVDMNPVAPHGLIGQAWDRDDKMVVGALDDYGTNARVVETSAMAEGAIEGSAVDYEIDHRNPFSTKFKYSRFGLKRAAPRDVSFLSGKKLVSLKKTASAGAMNDEDSEA